MVAYWRTRSRSPGTLNPNASVGWPARASPTKTVPGGRSSCGFGPGDAGDGKAHVGAQHRAGALGHGPGRILRHHRPLGHAEQGELDLRGVGHHRAPKPPAGAWDVDQPRRCETAGQRLGQPQRHAGGDDRPGHCVLDRLVVDAEHHIAGGQAEDATDLRLFGVEQSDRLLVVVGPHRDPHLDPLDATGEKGDGGSSCRAVRRQPALPARGRRVVRCARRAPRRGPTRSFPMCE